MNEEGPRKEKQAAGCKELKATGYKLPATSYFMFPKKEGKS
jgi:hypothetical protein